MMYRLMIWVSDGSFTAHNILCFEAYPVTGVVRMPERTSGGPTRRFFKIHVLALLLRHLISLLVQHKPSRLR